MSPPVTQGGGYGIFRQEIVLVRGHVLLHSDSDLLHDGRAALDYAGNSNRSRPNYAT